MTDGDALPDLRVGGLRVWVHGREFPDASDYWDGNWLNVTAECQYRESRVTVRGPIIHLGEVAKLLEGCDRLYASLHGTAALECIEPNLSVRLTMADKAGHVDVIIQITPDHMNQRHEYTDAIDQTFLPPIIESCREILGRHPLRGRP